MSGEAIPDRLKLVCMGLAGVFGAILFACIYFTRPGPPPSNWADGIYANPCCANIVIKDGMLLGGTCRIPYALKNGKFGIEADLPRRLGTRHDQITCSDSNGMFLFFDGMSQLAPPKASRPPKYFQLYDDDSGEERVFTRVRL